MLLATLAHAGEIPLVLEYFNLKTLEPIRVCTLILPDRLLQVYVAIYLHGMRMLTLMFQHIPRMVSAEEGSM